MNYEKHLKDLCNKLAREQMSLLIGAGFSKNVHHSFLSWDELLLDLTKELYCEEINIAYQQLAKTRLGSKPTLSAFSKQKCKEITSRIGYLEVVTEYIRRKGYPEAIATYIEERTPAIEKDGDDFLLKIGGNTVRIKAGRLNLHRKIIELPWNNIYTTNYDELLDCCIDEDQVGQLRKDIEDLENETLNLYKERDELIRQKETLPETPETPVTTGPGNPADLAQISTGQANDESVKERKEIEQKIDLNEAKIKDNDQTIKEKETALLSRYHVVRNATDLRLKRTKNIIKLHGSLRTQQQKDEFYFRFDGDPHKQYVIAKEDYDTYPVKHEAFTQLMRISLLQESFCLIGFSGVDPNFKAWINWVKDILHKEAIKNKHHHYKIYLIDVGSAEIPVDQQLFYENHSIIRIPLRSPAVMAFLQREANNRVKITDAGSALKALLIFLENGEFINPEISQIDLSVESARNKVWKDFRVFNFQKKPEHQPMVKTFERLDAIQGKIWIGNLNYSNTHNQHSLINFVNYQSYKAYILEDDADHVLKKLLLLAIKDYYVPISNFVDEDVLSVLLRTEETSNDTKVLLARVNSLNIIKSEEQSYYDHVLLLAYSFQFRELRSKLIAWDVKGKEIIQQSGFLSIFDSKDTAEKLSLMVEDDYVLTDEELLYGYELLHFLKNTYTCPVEKRISRAIRNYEKAGFQTLESKFEYIQEQFETKLTKPVPLGENRYSTSRSMSLSKHTKPEAALQYLMLLAETGFQLMVRHTYRYAAEAWYNLFLSGFEYYPYPFLFYSLQYRDEKFLKRIGQEYAFSEGNDYKVRNELPEISKRLLENFTDAPVDYQHNMLVVLSKLIIAVEPEVWQDEYLRIWNILLDQGGAFEDPARYAYLNFFISGMQYITDPKIILKLVEDALTKIKQGNPDQAISYLYYFNQNVYYKNAKGAGIHLSLKALIDETIEALTQSREDLIFVIGNIHVLLSDEQKGRVIEVLHEFDFLKVKNPRSWRIFLYFVKNDPNLKQAIKNALLQSNGMWYTGVTGNTYSMGGIVNLIELIKLTQSEYLTNGISWTQEEIEAIYAKLKKRLPDIQHFRSLDRESKFDFADVLDEMYWFLQRYKPQLEYMSDFKQTNDTTSQLFYTDRNYEALEDGLISDDHSTVVWALSELSILVFKSVAKQAQIKIVYYKVLLQNNPAIEAAISYLSAWARDILSNKELNDAPQLYMAILKRFRDNPLSGVDVAFVDKQLVVIAEQLDAIGYEDEIISWWLIKASQSVYNNIKQHLLSGSNDDDE